MSTTSARAPTTLGSYVAFVRAHIVLLLVGTLIGLGAGVVYERQRPPTYTAVSSVALTPLPTYVARNPDLLPATYITIDTEAQLVTSKKVLQPVARRMGVPLSVAKDRVLVTASAFSSVLHIAVSAPDRQVARSGARVAAQRLLVVLSHIVRSSQRNQTAQLSEDLNSLERQLPAATHSIDPAKADLLNTQILTLRQRLRVVQAALQSAGHVTEAGFVAQHSDSTNANITLETGALVGLVAGLIIAMAVDRRRRSHPHGAHQRLDRSSTRAPARVLRRFKLTH